MAREQDYISEVRTATRDLVDAYQRLLNAQFEYNALAYGDNLDDGTGDNAGITRAYVGSVVFDTTNAIAAVFAAGHATNVARLL